MSSARRLQAQGAAAGRSRTPPSASSPHSCPQRPGAGAGTSFSRGGPLRAGASPARRSCHSSGAGASMPRSRSRRASPRGLQPFSISCIAHSACQPDARSLAFGFGSGRRTRAKPFSMTRWRRSAATGQLSILSFLFAVGASSVASRAARTHDPGAKILHGGRRAEPCACSARATPLARGRNCAKCPALVRIRQGSSVSIGAASAPSVLAEGLLGRLRHLLGVTSLMCVASDHVCP